VPADQTWADSDSKTGSASSHRVRSRSNIVSGQYVEYREADARENQSDMGRSGSAGAFCAHWQRPEPDRRKDHQDRQFGEATSGDDVYRQDERTENGCERWRFARAWFGRRMRALEEFHVTVAFCFTQEHEGVWQTTPRRPANPGSSPSFARR
jgi:hypothetical protein